MPNINPPTKLIMVCMRVWVSSITNGRAPPSNDATTINAQYMARMVIDQDDGAASVFGAGGAGSRTVSFGEIAAVSSPLVSWARAVWFPPQNKANKESDTNNRTRNRIPGRHRQGE